MKKWILPVIALSLLCWPAQAQPMAGERGEATLDLGGAKVTVEYGRPELKGRDPESLISPGDEWRMGSNAATTLSTDADLKFGDKLVPKGKYVLRAKFVEKGTWHLKILKEDKSVVAEIPLKYHQASTSEELVTVKLEKQGSGGKFTLQWGKLTISANFQKA
ncbi:MAG: DUF2911 domain-containing protein [Acidobacteriota bacterium]